MKFLQGQTTTDFREVEKGCVLPGAICSLKGRVLFSFIAVPEGENVTLVLPAEQVGATLTHLKKYAVFSKTRVEDTSSNHALLGIVGQQTDTLLEKLGIQPPAARASSRTAEGTWASRLFNENRCLVALPASRLVETWLELQESAEVAMEDLWWAEDIKSGFATVFASGRDLYQPQELNYPALQGVSYNKGCYTGQEVVARLHFRGKLKQRLYRLETSTVAKAEAAEIFAGGAQVGEVVMAAEIAGGRSAMLAILKNAAALSGNLSLGEDGPTLQLQELPYELSAEKEE
jgi:folate-binding protein YgfZ